MIIRIDKLFEEFASQRLLDTDYPKHVLQHSDDIVGDFVNQEYDIGASSRPKYPMFPYMTKQDYEKAADDLRLSNADGFIGYNLRVNKKDGSSNYEPRAVKYRKMDLPATKHDREFYEMVIYSVRDDKVIAYYLCTKWRINKERKTAVFDFDGKPIGDDSLRQQLFADKQSMEMVSNYLQKLYHEKPDDNIDESYSQQKTLTNRFGSVIGFIKIDPTNGNQMLLNRFGSVRGYYQARTDITTNRLGSFVGNGNLLMTLLSEDNLKESVYNGPILRNIIVTDEFRKCAKRCGYNQRDIDKIGSLIQNRPQSWIPLGSGVYKIYFSPHDKNSGANVSDRVIFIEVKQENIYLITAFEKSQEKNITNSALEQIRKQAKLLGGDV